MIFDTQISNITGLSVCQQRSSQAIIYCLYGIQGSRLYSTINNRLKMKIYDTSFCIFQCLNRQRIYLMHLQLKFTNAQCASFFLTIFYNKFYFKTKSYSSCQLLGSQ